MGFDTYYERYRQLTSQYRICHGGEYNPDDFDVIVEPAGFGYAHTIYKIVKNAPRLDMTDLAIICDEGNVCFGFKAEYDIIKIYTD